MMTRGGGFGVEVDGGEFKGGGEGWHRFGSGFNFCCVEIVGVGVGFTAIFGLGSFPILNIGA